MGYGNKLNSRKIVHSRHVYNIGPVMFEKSSKSSYNVRNFCHRFTLAIQERSTRPARNTIQADLDRPDLIHREVNATTGPCAPCHFQWHAETALEDYNSIFKSLSNRFSTGQAQVSHFAEMQQGSPLGAAVALLVLFQLLSSAQS